MHSSAGSLHSPGYMSTSCLSLHEGEGHPAYLSLQANTSMPLVIPDRTDEDYIPSIPWWHSCETKSGHNLQSQQCIIPPRSV